MDFRITAMLLESQAPLGCLCQAMYSLNGVHMVCSIHRGLFRSSNIYKCRIHELGLDEEKCLLEPLYNERKFLVLPHFLVSTVTSQILLAKNGAELVIECNLKIFKAAISLFKCKLFISLT